MSIVTGTGSGETPPKRVGRAIVSCSAIASILSYTVKYANKGRDRLTARTVTGPNAMNRTRQLESAGKPPASLDTTLWFVFAAMLNVWPSLSGSHRLIAPLERYTNAPVEWEAVGLGVKVGVTVDESVALGVELMGTPVTRSMTPDVPAEPAVVEENTTVKLKGYVSLSRVQGAKELHLASDAQLACAPVHQATLTP